MTDARVPPTDEQGTPERCSVCQIVLVPVVYGFPGAELIGAAERSEISLGGCLTEFGNPQSHCPACDPAARQL